MTSPSATFPRYPDLAGKVAVVTGATGAIGAATCKLLAANGASVVVNARDRTAIDGVVRDITAHHSDRLPSSSPASSWGASW